MDEKIVLIDGNSIMNRAFYATYGRGFISPDGRSTNAIYGFLQILFKLIEEEKPKYLAVAFDLKGKNKRNEIYREYKAGRHSMPEDLKEQMDMIKEILECMQIKIVQKAGVEADDILGTIAKKASNENLKTIILTGDRDYFQLVDEYIVIRYPKTIMKKTEYIYFDEAKINEEYTLKPKDLIELKALMGDSSDNIPGVKGIGEKTAIKLVSEYKTIDKLYEAIEKGEAELSKGVLNKLKADKENAFMSRILGTIDINLKEDEFQFDLKEIELKTWKTKEFLEYLVKLNMKSIIDKLNLKNNESETLEKELNKKEAEKLEKINNVENLVEFLKSNEEIIDENTTLEIFENLKDINVLNYNESKEKLEKIKQEAKNVGEIYILSIYREIIPARSIFEYEKRELLLLNLVYKYLNLNIADGLDHKLYSQSISKEEIEYLNLAINLNGKYNIYTVKPEEIIEILEDEKIIKKGYGFRKLIVGLKEIEIETKNIVFDAKVVAYLLNSNIGKYTLEDILLRNTKINTGSFLGKYNEIILSYKEFTKEENKILTALKKILEYKTTSLDYSMFSNLDDLIAEITKTKNLNEKEIKDIIFKLDKQLANLKEIFSRFENFKKQMQEEKYNFVLSICILEKILMPKLDETNQTKLYTEIENKLISVLADIQYQGIHLNQEKLLKLGEEIKEELEIIENRIYKFAGYSLNISSPQQISKLLFEDLKLPIIRKTKTGYSTDVETLKKLEPYHEIIKYILEYRELAKLYSTYVLGLLNSVNTKTGKIHSNFNQTVTATGRISSTEPNMQNIPVRKELGKKIRGVFEPSKNLFIDADYSQIELRVLADMSEDEQMIKAFNNGLDIHKSTASTIFNIPLDEVTKEYRGYAKAVNFGIIYGISDFGLSEGTGLSIQEASKYIKMYLEKYSNVKKFMDDTVVFAKQNEFVQTKYGRIRYVENINSKNHIIKEAAKRIAMNAPIQGTAADIMKLSMIKVHEELNKNNLKSKLILQVHDEILVDTVFEEEQKVTEIIKECMENIVKLKVDLKVDIEKGKNWEESK